MSNPLNSPASAPENKKLLSAAGHRRSGIPRRKETNIAYEQVFGERSKSGRKRRQFWGREIKAKSQGPAKLNHEGTEGAK